MHVKKATVKSTKPSTPHVQSPSFIFSRYTIAHIDHPQRNEDRLLVDRHRGLAVVCDGVGGMQAGDVAAQLAIQSVQQGWRQMMRQHSKKTDFLQHKEDLDLHEILARLIEEAQAEIVAEGERVAELAEQEQQEFSYPGTTLAMIILCKTKSGDYRMGHAHIGDSRIYLLREGEPLRRLTQDDSYLTIKVADQSISEEEAWYIDQATRKEQLSELELNYFSKRNGITQALQHPYTLQPEQLIIHTGEIVLAVGDRVLICSDGLHDNLTDREIEETLRDAPANLVALRLVEQAGARSREDTNRALRAKADDISAIVISRQK
ncbi:MAG TPA: PP2C family serine/threonine-protein phosphatase [Ktedonobacteraceae bacterium]|nr:PP2C family serine/threonine-protein phosphatase [Ktedonobacteraceae bacterium]